MSKIASGIFLIIFGFFFAAVPTGVALRFMSIGGGIFTPILLFFAVFIIVGLSIFISGFKMIFNHFKKKKIMEKGISTTAKFIRMGSNISNRSARYYYIVFSFLDSSGNEITYKTKNEYKIDEANYFASLGKFSIKYIDKKAVIVEEIDYHKMEQLNPESNNKGLLGSLLNTLTGKTQEIKPTEYYYICDYCGSIQDKSGKCKTCGAKIHPENKKIKH